jgi:2-amino-4-hydroxy-6-hydroxymethyldihydropteridine diphosphokinase
MSRKRAGQTVTALSAPAAFVETPHSAHLQYHKSVPAHMSGRLPEYYIPYMVDVALSLGSNSGDRRFYMRRMEEDGRTDFSGRYFRVGAHGDRAARGHGDQPWYLNRIVRGGFGGSARELLEECKAIERSLGRTNKGMRMERTADVDILLFGQCEIADLTHYSPSGYIFP